MTLTTHAVVGAAMASLVPSQPVLGFVLGFASHFAIDSIPHWAEGQALLRSIVKDKQDAHNDRIRGGKDLLHDVLVVSADGLLGIASAVLLLGYFFHAPLFVILLGAFAGELPDGLQFIYFKLHPHFMDGLQKFHDNIQTEHASLWYLLYEVGLIGGVVALGMFGVFVV